MLLGGVIVTIVTGSAVATAGLLQVKGFTDAFTNPPAPFQPDTVTQAPPGRPQTLLLVGSDHRFGDPGKDARSDTMMLVRLDPKQSAITVLSIPRDLAVTIPGRGMAKINESYTLGGLDLTARTIKTLLGTRGQPFEINHAMTTTFSGFAEAVNPIACVYVAVARRYYHSNAGLPVGARYSEIDVRAGYQQLCGKHALEYVRFRHEDNDLVRAARQQSFLTAAKDQLNHQGVTRNFKPLLRIFGRATQTDGDLRSTKGLLRLAKLAIYTAGLPVKQIHFPATLVAGSEPQTVAGTTQFQTGTSALGDYVTTTPDQLRQVVRRFLHPGAPHRVTAQAPRRKHASSTRSADLRPGLAQVKALAKPAGSRRATR